MPIQIDSNVEPHLYENAAKVVNKRYLWKDAQGNLIETPRDMFIRVATVVGEAELKFGASQERANEFATQVYEAHARGEFIANTPTLVNATRPNGQLAACFVLPMGDSLDEIYSAMRDQALVQKSGGGTGFAFGMLRESNSLVKSTGKKSTGPVPFIRLFNYSMSEIIEQGGVRNGANMGTLDVDHPDVFEFASCKEKDGAISSFNLSVCATDKFMNAVIEDGDHELVSRVDGSVVRRVRARHLLRHIAECAHRTGDPGVLFIDTANKFNPTPQIGRLLATNPCGEQWLLANEACTLAHINLGKLYDPGAHDIDWAKLKRLVHMGIRFLDDIVEMNCYPIKAIEEMHRANRKIGLGVMGWADLLVKAGIPYDSDDALRLADRVASYIRREADEQSVKLAEERGPFPNFRGSALEDLFPHGIRNACRLTVAPTGSTGIICDASTGIEPFFALVLERTQAGMKMHEVIRIVRETLGERPDFDDIIEYIKSNNGSLQGYEPLARTDTDRLFKTANEIHWSWHIKHQAAWQKHVDNSISKTINMARDATVEDVEEAYVMAWKMGCKGITVYRDGSRSEQALAAVTNTKGKLEKEAPATVQGQGQRTSKRARVTRGTNRKIPTPEGNLMVYVGENPDGRIDDIVARIGKNGGISAAYLEALTRITSLASRHGVPVEEIVDQLRGIRTDSSVRYKSPYIADGKPIEITSTPDALAVAIGEHLFERDLDRAAQEVATAGNGASTDRAQVAQPSIDLYIKATKKQLHHCPECSGKIDHGAGCAMCPQCGFSAC